MDYTDTKIEARKAEKKIAREFQERRHVTWDEIYSLYRNKVKTNRLTQRQAVNIPLMKETVKTILSKIDDPPFIDWKEKSGDEVKELIYQEIWDQNFKNEKFELVDILDKKYVLLYGLSTKMLNLSDSGVTVDVLDPYDVVFDPMTNPLKLDTARFLVRQNIFRSLKEILTDKRYTKEGRESLKIWATLDRGIVQSNLNKEEYAKKLERIKNMGVNSSEFPDWGAGDVIVSLCEHYYHHWNGKEFEKRVCVYADDNIMLLDERLIDLVGVDFWPFVVWSEDPQLNDIYSDGIGDLVLTPNKVVNVWFSQQAENRTLRNFQMHWYDATVQGYKPQTYEPGPGLMLPAPGDPTKTIKPVDISGLEETLDSINWLIGVIERGSGATAIEKGTGENKEQTLGEVKILVGKALERTTAIAKFYRNAWYELAVKWNAMMQANNFKKLKLYKTGKSGKVYEKVVYNSDWKSSAGYEPTVTSISEQELEQTKTMQRFLFVQAQFPNNTELRKITQRKELELLKLTPDELKRIEQAQDEADMMEKQQKEAAVAQTQAQGMAGQQVEPQNDAMAGQIQDQLNQIVQLNGA